MNNDYQDKLLNCRECGMDFIFSGREQEFYVQKGFDHEPTRCVQCRSQRRRERNVVTNSAAVGSQSRTPQYNTPPQHYNNSGNSQPNFNGYHNQTNNGINNQRSGGAARPGGISNGYRPNSYGTRQFGPNYSTLGRNTVGTGYNTTRPAYGMGGNAGFYNNSYNRNAGGNFNPGFNPGNGGMEQERKMYPIVCARCGINTEVPFPPRETTPVFCRTCYNGQKNNR